MTTPIDIILRFIKTGQGDDQAVKALKDIERTSGGAASGMKNIDTQAAKSVQSTKNLTASFAKFAAGATAVIAVGKQVVDFQKENIRLAGIQEDAETQLAQTIKSTGAAAGFTATELKQMASGLQGVTKFGDEATIQGQSLLLTFTNIGKDVFPRATETMLDMSQALGQDMKSSAIQLGKALNDPITGVSALQRVGVSFTEQQKEQIKTMAESGRVMEAQNVILDELSRQFGGSAAAAAETYTGKIEQQANAWGDLREQIGLAVRPTGDQVDATIGLIGAGTAYLTLQNRLTAEVKSGNITQWEAVKIMNQVTHTTVTATEVMDRFTQADIEAEQAEQALSARIHDSNQLMKDRLPILNDAAKAFVEQDQTLRNVNRTLLEFGGNLGPTTRELEEMAYATGNVNTAQDTLKGTIQSAASEVRTLTQDLNDFIGDYEARASIEVIGIQSLEHAEGLLEAIQNAAGMNSGDAFQEPTPSAVQTGPTEQEIQDIEQGITPQAAVKAVVLDQAIRDLTVAISTANAEAAALVDTLGLLPTEHNFVIKITTDGQLPVLPKGVNAAALATGGPITGGIPYTGPGADNVIIGAQTGEYMLKRSAVNKLGLNRLNYMNSTGRLPGFAEGGYIGDGGGGSMAGASVMFAPVIQVSGVVSQQQGMESGRNILNGLVDAARGRGVRI